MIGFFGPKSDLALKLGYIAFSDHSSMPRAYKPMLPIWYVRARLKLTQEYPSGLMWIDTTGHHKAGEMAGKWNGRYYMVRMSGDQYHAHRIVYYLRTGKDPGNADVLHDKDNTEKDNRKPLTLFQRKPSKYGTTNQFRRNTATTVHSTDG